MAEDDDLLDLTAAERALRKLADDAREQTAAGCRPDDLFESYRLVIDELDRLRERLRAIEGEGPHLDGRQAMRAPDPADQARIVAESVDVWNPEWREDLRRDVETVARGVVELVRLTDEDRAAMVEWVRDRQHLDPPPFAPELADVPLVTGESGTPAPLVVDQPVHDSTLPAELEERDEP